MDKATWLKIAPTIGDHLNAIRDIAVKNNIDMLIISVTSTPYWDCFMIDEDKTCYDIYARDAAPVIQIDYTPVDVPARASEPTLSCEK